MAKDTSGGLSAISEDNTETPSTGGLQGTSTINVGGQKISTKGALQGQALLDAMQEEYSRRVPDSNLGRFNTFLEGMKDAVAITSRDPGSAMAARDQEKRLRDESLFQMRANMATLRGQMAQQASTSAMMNGTPQGGAQGATQAGAPQGGGSPVQQMINSLPPSLQGQGRRLAAEGQFDALAKMVQDFEVKKPELQKNMEFINAMPEGPEKERMRRQVQDKTFGVYEDILPSGETRRYTLGNANVQTPNVADTTTPGATQMPAIPAQMPAIPAQAPAQVSPPAPTPSAAKPAMPAQAPAKPISSPDIRPQLSPFTSQTPNPALAKQSMEFVKRVEDLGAPSFTPKPAVPGKSDDTGLPNTFTPGTQQYVTQRAKNAETATELQKAQAQSNINIGEHGAKSAIDVAAETGKASNKIYGEEYAKIPEQKEKASNTIAAADRVIAMANDPVYRKLMGYFNGGNKAASALVGVLNNVPGHLFDKDRMETAMASLGFTEAERTAFNQLKTDAASLGIQYTADMFHGARLGIGLEKLGATGKGVSSDFTPATNKLFAQVTKNNAEFVLDGHRTFRDQWAPAHPGKNWGDFIQSREYDNMIDQHLAAQRALTKGTPIEIKKLSVDEAKKAGSGSGSSGSILNKYKIKG